MSYGYDEFESKLGQFVYTMVMYERLKEYLVEKVRGRGRVSVRIDLGKDKVGNQVFMDVLLTSVRPQMVSAAAQSEQREVKKLLFIVLSNADVRGDSRQIAEEMERLISESLKWWHGYFGERDKLSLSGWKAERVSLLEGEAAEPLVHIPVESIFVPPSAMIPLHPDVLDRLAPLADLLSPIKVRKSDSSHYELVSGYPQLMLSVEKLGFSSVKAMVLDIPEEDAERMRAESSRAFQHLARLTST